MKIALVIPTLTLGGAEKIALETALGFAEAGHDVSIIVLTNKIVLTVPNNIKVYKDITNVFSLMKILYKEKFEHCISYMERANFLSAIACCFFKVKHCATVHTAPAAGFKLRSLKNRLAISLTYTIIKILNSKVIGVCDGILSDLEYMYGIKNSYAIPNFLDTDKIEYLASLDDINDCYDFLFVGRLSSVKGCHIFIDALAGIKSFLKEKNIKIAIIGDGPEMDNIMAQIHGYGLNNYVHMLGAKINPYPYIKRSRYLIVPSYAEGFGMVVLEGLTLGAKIIFSRCDFGPREIIGKYFSELNGLGFEDPSRDRGASINELKKIIINEIHASTPFERDIAKHRVELYYNRQKICAAFIETLNK